MTTKERRHHPRISALNLISYNCIDETEQIVAQGMGRTLNVSKGGILLETHISIDPKNAIALSIGLEDELINIKGKVVFSAPGKDEKFEAGIEFLEMPDSTLNILKKFIKVFSEQ
ncbi:MAG: PilZ domain-containing protein [Deltaproteobacteria bacterium]|jgi:c-di-GMP-binding flagellar brake protein YcgR|nr:PilZ domain-containing protein [Deltaproteobacteria bacterium]MBW2571787.1 PilZ domain-containing protein [Deltaproteobacteria bacterium]MBW2669435.1 PilZ domain-containing protein [Deltaproteobacteria bacterium]